MFQDLEGSASPGAAGAEGANAGAAALSTIKDHMANMDWTSPDDYMRLGELTLINYGPPLIAAIAIFVIGRWIAKLMIRLLSKVLQARKVDTTLIGFLSGVLYAMIMAAVVIAAIGRLGVNTTSLTAILAAGGLAVGFALQGSLGNFASGVMIILFKPFRVGDFIEGGGSTGTVKEVGVFATILTTGDNKRIIVPNGGLISGNIINYSAFPTRRIDMVIGVGYGDDLKQAYAVLERVVKADERVLKDPEPKIAVSELGDSSVNFVVRPWVKGSDYWPTRWDLTEKIKLALDDAGISIPYPHQEVYMHQVQETAQA